MTQVRRYRLVRTIATGGMVTDYEAVASGDGGYERRVALRRILPGHGAHEPLRRTQMAATKTACRLRHHGVVRVTDWGLIDSDPFLVTESVDGLTAKEAVRRAAILGQPLPVGIALHVAAEVAHVLSHLETILDASGRALSVVHRDVSPRNLVLSWNGDVKLGGFGMAFGGAPNGAGGGFLSPELTDGRELTGAADIYALGASVHFMVTGEPPRGPRGLAPGAPSIDDDLRDLLARCLDPLPTERPAPRALAARAGHLAAQRVGRDCQDALAEWLAPLREVEGLAVAADARVGATLVPNGEGEHEYTLSWDLDEGDRDSDHPDDFPGDFSFEGANTIVEMAPAWATHLEEPLAPATAPLASVGGPSVSIDLEADLSATNPDAPPVAAANAAPPEAQGAPALEAGRQQPPAYKSREANRDAPLVGQSVLGGKLHVVGVIGVGGLGVVYEVEHSMTRHRRAMKVLHPRHVQSHDIVNRMMREATVAGTLDTPYVVEIFDAGLLEDGSPYLLMERLDGETLGERISGQGLNPSQVARVAWEACEGLAAAHAAGIVHRDLKPDNLFLGRSAGGPDRVRILDFGVSKFSETPMGVVTGHGSVLGTPFYMSPEQTEGAHQVDARTDVYALGVVMYQALVGLPPFHGPNFPVLVQKIRAGHYLSIREAEPDIDSELASTVEKAMHRDPSKRFQTIAEFQAALDAHAARSWSEGATLPPGVLEAPGLPVKKPWLAIGVAAMALTALAGVAAWYLAA